MGVPQTLYSIHLPGPLPPLDPTYGSEILNLAMTSAHLDFIKSTGLGAYGYTPKLKMRFNRETVTARNGKRSIMVIMLEQLSRMH